jgi:hypothetical protein
MLTENLARRWKTDADFPHLQFYGTSAERRGEMGDLFLQTRTPYKPTGKGIGPVAVGRSIGSVGPESRLWQAFFFCGDLWKDVLSLLGQTVENTSYIKKIML